MRSHLENFHQCALVRTCDKDWAIADFLESPLEIYSSCQPCQANNHQLLSCADGDIEGTEKRQEGRNDIALVPVYIGCLSVIRRSKVNRFCCLVMALFL